MSDLNVLRECLQWLCRQVRGFRLLDGSSVQSQLLAGDTPSWVRFREVPGDLADIAVVERLFAAAPKPDTLVTDNGALSAPIEQ